jgi:hypothetical protein
LQKSVPWGILSSARDANHPAMQNENKKKQSKYQIAVIPFTVTHFENDASYPETLDIHYIFESH